VLGQAGGNIAGAIAVGIVAGVVSAAVLWLLLRFDPTIVPAYVVTGPVLTMLHRALQIGTPLAYLTAAAAVAAAVGMTWLVMRYIQVPLVTRTAGEGIATASSPNTA
jgi:hypothetical protein